MRCFVFMLGVISLVAATLSAQSEPAWNLQSPFAQKEQESIPKRVESHAVRNGGLVIALNVMEDPSAYHDNALAEQIRLRLIRKQNLKIVDTRLDGSIHHPDVPLTEKEQTPDETARMRYAVDVQVRPARLERQLRIHVPLIFHLFQTVGVLEGELRIYDMTRNKLVLAEPFAIQLAGPRSFQASTDENPFDSDLNLSSPEKLAFFSRLEARAADHLTEKIQRYARGG